MMHLGSHTIVMIGVIPVGLTGRTSSIVTGWITLTDSSVVGSPLPLRAEGFVPPSAAPVTPGPAGPHALRSGG
jgi:hypothetical protein